MFVIVWTSLFNIDRSTRKRIVNVMFSFDFCSFYWLQIFVKIRHAEVIALLKRDGWCPGDVISLDGDDAAPNGDLWLISSAPRPQAKQATSPAIAWFRELAQLVRHQLSYRLRLVDLRLVELPAHRLLFHPIIDQFINDKQLDVNSYIAIANELPKLKRSKGIKIISILLWYIDTLCFLFFCCCLATTTDDATSASSNG